MKTSPKRIGHTYWDSLWTAADECRQVLAGQPIGRIVGPEAMKFDGWQRLNAEYAKQFGPQKEAQ